MQRGVRRRLPVVTAWLVFVAVAWPAFAQSQEWSPARDPVLRAMTQARREQRFADAEKILTAAIPSAERTAPNRQLGFYLADLAGLYSRKGDRARALNLAQRALENDRSLFGPADIRVAPRMTLVASFLQQQKRTQEAEQLFKQAAELALQAPNPNALAPDSRAGVLISLASFYLTEGRIGEAVQWYEDALKMCGDERLAPMCDLSRRNLAELYRRQGRLTDAERLPTGSFPAELASIDRQSQQSMRDRLYVQAEINYKRAINWIEQNPKAGVDGLLAGEWLGVGQALEAQGRNDQAEDAYKKSIEVQEARVNPKAPVTASGFGAVIPLMNLYRQQGRIQELEPIIQRALAIQEKVLGAEHAYLAETLMQLASVYEEEGKTDAARYSGAVGIYERVLKIQEKSFGPDAQQLARALTGYADVLRKLHQGAKAAEVQARLDRIRKGPGR